MSSGRSKFSPVRCRVTQVACLLIPPRARLPKRFTMPARYVIDKERRLVITTGSGRVTFAEIKAHQDQLLNDPNFNPEFNQLLDMTAVISLDLSVGEAQIAASRRLFSPTSRRAFVATSPTIFGMGRMMEAYHELSTAASLASIFHDLPSALKWLGLESVP
jgi:hypothetical protein